MFQVGDQFNSSVAFDISAIVSNISPFLIVFSEKTGKFELFICWIKEIISSTPFKSFFVSIEINLSLITI